MPTESDSKKSSDSEKSLPGWLAKCGISIPNFSVRGRQGSPEGPNRPVMAAADSSKNIKRSFSPLPSDTSPRKLKRVPSSVIGQKTAIQYEEPKVSDMAAETLDPRSVFHKNLQNKKAINKANAEYQSLLQHEEVNSWDREARDAENLDEVRAATIIRAIREYERNIVFGNLPSEALPGKDTRDMGGQYLTNKARIDNESQLHKIAIKVPKGALLHIHFNSELHPERLLERARLMENLYIWSIRPLLTEEDLDSTEMVFNVLDSTKVEPDVNIFSRAYKGTGDNWKKGDMVWKVWMPWKKFQEEFKTRFGEKYTQPENTSKSLAANCCSEPGQVELNPAEVWLRSKMVLSEEEAYGFTQTVNGVWARFNQATRCFKGLMNYESVYKWYIGQAIDRMILENVMYAELRPMLLDKAIPSDDGKRKVDNIAQMTLIEQALDEKEAELAAKGEKEKRKFPFRLKIIYCTPRSIPKNMMREELMQCIELKLKFPKLICGFDLVGAEDRPNHIGFYREELVAFQQTCEDLKIKIPFMFHAGETLLDTGGSADPKNSNLYEAVVLNAKRIGHGFSLMKHPQLVEKFKKTEISKGICVELCPISNELLHLCRNIKEHPYPELLAAGIPCTVNSDNPSLFSNSMAHEFYQIMVGAPTMSLYSWKQLARWSIDYSCLEEDDQAKAHMYLNAAWNDFCGDIVKTYESIMEGDEVDLAKAEIRYRELKEEQIQKPKKGQT